MKKSTIMSLISYLKGETVTNVDEILEELESEVAKGKAKADANRALYDEIRVAVFNALKSASQPVTAQELADETGYPKGKIVYGLTNYWTDDVKKIDGKVSTYTLQ